jgi:glycosyltransferase involved in cell wall biosynthesis
MRLVVADLVRNLDREKLVPSLCVHRKSGNALETELAGLVDEFFELPLRVSARPLGSVRERLDAIARCWRGRFDVIHSFDYSSAWPEAAVSRALGTPFIMQKMNMTWGSARWWLYGMLANRIVCLSKEQQRQLFAGTILARKTRLIYIGVDLDLFRPQPSSRLNMRRDLGIKDHSVALVCVANLVPSKGHMDLLTAFAAVDVGPRDVSLTIVGGGEPHFVESLKRRREELGLRERVIFLDGRNDVPSLLPAFDGFVMASHSDSLAAVFIEAMACALPVIGTRCGGPADVIVPGETGWLVDVGAIRQLTIALNELVKDHDRRKRYGQAGRQRAELRYSLDDMVRGYETLYREIMISRYRGSSAAGVQWDRPGGSGAG